MCACLTISLYTNIQTLSLENENDRSTSDRIRCEYPRAKMYSDGAVCNVVDSKCEYVLFTCNCMGSKGFDAFKKRHSTRRVVFRKNNGSSNTLQ